MGVSFVFLISGVIILVGFFGALSFERTKVPDVLILLGIGIILGPVFKLIDPQRLAHFAEYFGTLALMIILFEGGMDTALDKLIAEFGGASFLVLLSFVLSTVAITSYVYYVNCWDLTRSLLLGIILGCTSAAVVIPVISRMSVKEEIKTILSIESALSDVLAVVLTVSLIEFIHLESIGIDKPFKAIASSFSIAIVAGVAAGLFWLKILDSFQGRRYSYMITFSAMLILVSFVNFLGGSGPISILIFGIILGNSGTFFKFIKIKDRCLADSNLKFFHSEVTFFIRTFFFVYMGMMISFANIDYYFISLSVALVLIILATRFISVSLIGLVYPEKRRDKLVMMSMLPRGLASAVLATLPIAAGIKNTEIFLNYTFAVIVLTNILMTIGVFYAEKNGNLAPAQRKTEADD